MGIPQILILGIGNPLLGDDGFGVEVARRLGAQTGCAVEILDGGAAGLYLLPHLTGRSHILVVDAIDFGGAPGQMIRLGLEDVPGFLSMKLSEHQVTFHEVLALMGLVGIEPQEFAFIGVQPGSNRWGDLLSPEVEAAIPSVMEAVSTQVATWIQTSPQLSHGSQMAPSLPGDPRESSSAVSN